MKLKFKNSIINLSNLLPPPVEGEINRPLSARLRDSFQWKQMFCALHYRNYRLWFWGQMISLFGTWMQSTAQGFLVYELTHSPAYLGYTMFAMGLPTWIFMIYGGVLADRVQRRNLLVYTQLFMMVLALCLAGLTFLKIVHAWHIILLAFGLGIANAFDAPARQAFVQELVDHHDITNAIALNSAMFNTATALGPAISGLVYSLVGPAWCFMINAISFVGVIIPLLLMTLKPKPKSISRNSAWSDIKEGLHFILNHSMIRTLILIVGMTSFFGISFATLIPAWAVNVLGGDASTNGFLQSARGFGSFLSALLIASLGRFQFKGKLLTWGGFIFPVLLIIFSLIHWLAGALVILFFIGVSIMLIFNLGNALVQTLVPDPLRGRVMSVYALSFFGLMPLGSLWVGMMSEHFSEALAIILSSLILLLFFLLIRIRIPKLNSLP
jgi:MFS family permease